MDALTKLLADMKLGKKYKSSAYVEFIKEMHPKLKAKNPKLKTAAIYRVLGKKWNGLSRLSREHYKNKADAHNAG